MYGETTGAVRAILRIEGLCMLLLATYAYFYFSHQFGVNGWWFVVLFMVPDLIFLAYFAGPKIGGALYNAVHTYVSPLACALLGSYFEIHALILGAAIWFAHLGYDRMRGNGLKYPQGFAYTHLRKIRALPDWVSPRS